MRFLSLFSGIEAASTAWDQFGWECVGVSEIEPMPCLILRTRFPHVPNLGDVTKITEVDIARLGRIDLIVFGSPCQDLSVAGKRKGLDGERSGLFFTALDIIGWARKHCGLRFALWENVPAAFTSTKGADFAVVVGSLAGMDLTPDVPKKGWGTEGAAVGEEGMVEWSTLDAQWFGVAQRRRRVFALADFGDWAGRPPILLEPEGMRGDSAPSRGQGEVVAGTLASRTGAGGYPGTDEALDGHVIRDRPVQLAFGGNNTAGPIDVSTALNASGTASGRLDFESETFVAEMLVATCVTGDATHALTANGFYASEDGTGRGRGSPIIAFHANAQPDEMRFDEHVSAPLTVSQNAAVAQAMSVRRLTPTECERLQAFPDGHTLVRKANGKFVDDGPRYKALGNSMCVNVMVWIGRQIDFVTRWWEPEPQAVAADEDLFA